MMLVQQSAGDEIFQRGNPSVSPNSDDPVSPSTDDDQDTTPLGFAEAMAAFALALQESPSDRADVVLQQIVDGAVATIPHVDHAAVVTPAGPRRLEGRAASGGALPAAIMTLQNEFGSGPCLDAIETNEQIRSDELGTDPRWPGFVERAAEAGAAAMLSTPLVVGGSTIGVLTLISTAGGFDDEAQSLARIFAAHAAIALAGAQHNQDMLAALSSRDVIGQAKGILMERFKLTPDLAFATLVRVSSTSNVKLRVVCEELCRTGSLRDDRPSQGSGSSGGRAGATVAGAVTTG